MITNDIYMHINTYDFACDKILKIISGGVSDSAEALMYNVVDGECTHETLNADDIKNIILDKDWVLLDAQFLCDLLYKYNTDRKVRNKMLEARAATIRDLNDRLKDANKNIDKLHAELQDLKREREQLKKNIERQNGKTLFWIAQNDETNARYDAAVTINKDLRKENNELRNFLSNIDGFVDQTGLYVLLQDGSERLIKGGVRHAFDSINDMFYVMDKEDETIAGFESDFVRGFMPVNRRQQRCD